jgi:hypothetical protein
LLCPHTSGKKKTATPRPRRRLCGSACHCPACSATSASTRARMSAAGIP